MVVAFAWNTLVAPSPRDRTPASAYKTLAPLGARTRTKAPLANSTGMASLPIWNLPESAYKTFVPLLRR